jgi:hypothetical protein
MRSGADWLIYRFGISRRSVQRYVRAARALSPYPVVRAALGAGELCLDQAVALASRLEADEDASLEREAELTQAAVGLSADALARAARLARPVTKDEAQARHEARRLRFRFDPEEGMLHLWGALADTEGASLREALRRRAAKMGKNPETDAYDPIEARMADALAEMAKESLGADPDPDRATVVVFTRGAAPELRFGPTISEDSWERLSCDARAQEVEILDDGSLGGIEDLSRTVPPWLRRVIEERDGGCAWPGCGRTDTLLHAHHILHHRHGGPTAAWNLTLLCYLHHRAVHEGGFCIRGQPGDLRFFRPDGTPLAQRRASPWTEALARLKVISQDLAARKKAG